MLFSVPFWHYVDKNGAAGDKLKSPIIYLKISET